MSIKIKISGHTDTSFWLVADDTYGTYSQNSLDNIDLFFPGIIDKTLEIKEQSGNSGYLVLKLDASTEIYTNASVALRRTHISVGGYRIYEYTTY